MAESSSSSLVSINSPTTVPYIKCNFLDKNTDLNEKPVWNNEIALLLSYWLQQQANHDDVFRSFRSANAHTDSLGEVDVISDAEHIKKLLKVPFNKHSQISMIVHRLGRTILLDEFDVHSHLLRLEKNEWTWFRDFFLDTILRNISVKHFYKKNKTRDELIRKDRLVRFLLQSVELPQLTRSDIKNDETRPTTTTTAALLQEIKNLVNANNNDNNLDDDNNENKTTNSTSSPFQRTVNWTFENMKMLIGSDLPIFGDEQHPAVSLRLRDMNKPINVLTGIDCWLDNLMCNVPELAMCYHVDGIVQSYEIIKTEDIPYREGCQFPPTVIRDLATNLLSFLKANATKEGHTYWLFKGPDDDIVKLYDLTSLCETDRCDNPYTLPVATLLYKMAHNMVLKSDHETRLKESGTIRTLLKHCLDMLDPEKFPEYYCAAAYMMSDLYIDDNLSEQNWTFDHNSASDSNLYNNDLLYENEDESVAFACVDIKSLVQSQQHRFHNNVDVPRFGPIHGNLDGRAREALQYLVAALRSNVIHRRLQASTKTDDEDQTSTDKIRKSKAIVPLPYQITQNSQKSLIDSKNSLINDRRLQSIIFRKAACSYFCLVERCEQEKNYGSCLRYLQLALNCYSAEMKLQSVNKNHFNNECKKLLSHIMSVAGDCRLMISHFISTENFDKFREQYQTMNDVDNEIQNAINEIGINENCSEFSWVFELTFAIEDNLSASARAYEYAINLIRQLGEHEKQRLNILIKRLGNVRNEMGVFWMNRYAQEMKKYNEGTTNDIKDCFRQSFENFDAGINAFEKINDISNMALLYSNLGRLMRYYAQFYASIDNSVTQEFSQQERQCYHKAFDYYLRGLKLVENRSDSFEVYRTLSWELSNSYFAMAISLQDHAPLSTISQEDVEKEIIDCMTRALKYLETELNSSTSDRYSLAKYRAGTIHHRLASLLHNAFRTEANKTRRKYLRSLASLHYEKALKLYSANDNPLEYLRLLIEEVALADFELQNANDNSSRLKYSQLGLRSSFQCYETIGIIEQHRTSSDPDDYNELFAQEAQRLLAILNGRIRTFLKEIVKILKNATSKKLIYEDYKEMYNISLRLNDTSTTFPRDLYDAIERLKKLYDKNTSE